MVVPRRRRADLSRGLPASDELEYLELPIGELLDAAELTRTAGEAAENLGRDFAADVNLAAEHLPDRSHHARRCFVLRDVAFRSGAQTSLRIKPFVVDRSLRRSSR